MIDVIDLGSQPESLLERSREIHLAKITTPNSGEVAVIKLIDLSVKR